MMAERKRFRFLEEYQNIPLGEATSDEDSPLQLTLERCPACLGNMVTLCGVCEGKTIVEIFYTTKAKPPFETTHARGHLNLPVVLKPPAY